jgi:hypothetical protein
MKISARSISVLDSRSSRYAHKQWLSQVERVAPDYAQGLVAAGCWLWTSQGKGRHSSVGKEMGQDDGGRDRRVAPG